jgi:hypothetical protein
MDLKSYLNSKNPIADYSSPCGSGGLANGSSTSYYPVGVGVAVLFNIPAPVRVNPLPTVISSIIPVLAE